MSTDTLTAPTARPTGFDDVLEVPLSVAVRSAAAMLAVIRDDKITPILNAAHFDGAHLLASDRMRCAKFELPATPAKSGDRLLLRGDMLIPTAALTWVTRVKPDREKAKQRLATMSDAGYTIRYTKVEPNIVVELIDMFGETEQMELFAEPTGNFPPLKRLFEKTYPEAPAGTVFHYEPKLLVSIMTWAGKHGGELVAVSTSVKPVTSGGTDPGPTTITCAEATFLIMPCKPKK